MAQTQKTIRFNKETDLLVKQISPSGEENYNYAVNQIAHRYSILCKYLDPKLSHFELLACCQAYNGHWFNSDIELEAKAFCWQLKEALVYDGNVRELLLQDRIAEISYDYELDDSENAIAILNHEICSDFLKKLERLTIPEIIAIFQKIHEFWTK